MDGVPLAAHLSRRMRERSHLIYPVATRAVLLVAAGATVAASVAARTADAAWFHLRLLRAEPAADARLGASPPRVALWFTERPELAVTRVRLLDARGTPVALAAPTRADSAGAPVVAVLPRPIGVGTYTVVWRTMARDGHVSDGRYAFLVGGAAR